MDLRKHWPEERTYGALGDGEEPDSVTVCAPCTDRIAASLPKGQGVPVKIWPCSPYGFVVRSETTADSAARGEGK